MNVIDELDAEWRVLVGSRSLRRAVQAWGAEDPPLRFDGPAALVAAVEQRRSPRHADAVLAALARRAGRDLTAARVLLQLLLPGCKALVRAYGRQASEERAALVVAEAWERIRTYPIERRPQHVAANVLLDVRQRLLRRIARQRDHVSLDDVPESTLPTVPGGPGRGEEAIALIGSALRSGAIDPEGAELVVLTRVAGYGIGELARREGADPQTLRRRRLRVEARIRRAALA